MPTPTDDLLVERLGSDAARRLNEDVRKVFSQASGAELQELFEEHGEGRTLLAMDAVVKAMPFPDPLPGERAIASIRGHLAVEALKSDPAFVKGYLANDVDAHERMKVATDLASQSAPETGGAYGTEPTE